MTRIELAALSGGKLPAEYWLCVEDANGGCGEVWPDPGHCPKCGKGMTAVVPPLFMFNPCPSLSMSIEELKAQVDDFLNTVMKPRDPCPRKYTGDYELSCTCIHEVLPSDVECGDHLRNCPRKYTGDYELTCTCNRCGGAR